MLVGRRLSWWWKRFRRTFPGLLAAVREGGGLEVMLILMLLLHIEVIGDREVGIYAYLSFKRAATVDLFGVVL